MIKLQILSSNAPSFHNKLKLWKAMSHSIFDLWKKFFQYKVDNSKEIAIPSEQIHPYRPSGHKLKKTVYGGIIFSLFGRIKIIN